MGLVCKELLLLVTDATKLNDKRKKKNKPNNREGAVYKINESTAGLPSSVRMQEMRLT